MEGAWTLLHPLSSFSFVGTRVVADWNSRAARGTEDWARRATLFAVVSVLSMALLALMVLRWKR